MEKTTADLIAEVKELQRKYSDLDAKYKEETASLKKQEEELRLKMMFLEGIANSAIDGFLVLDPAGQKILQNQRTIDLWKIPPEVVNDPDGRKQVSHVMHMTKNPELFVAEIEHQIKHPEEKNQDELELIDGTVLDRYSSPVIGPDGKHYGRIYAFHDVTERKNLEKNLIDLITAKDRFLSILAHDLRSPFNSLLGFSEILCAELHTSPIERTEELVTVICQIIRKTHELLEDTLLWASIQSQKITFNPAISDITEIISEVTEILDPIAKAKKLTIEHLFEEKVMARADTYMFKAVLRNLITNSMKFTNEGGKIKISAAHSDSATSITVADNGVGIKPEILNKLFNLSTIQSAKGTANETGTGLGLLLCKEFVEKHGGKIRIESKVGIGTSVIFTLPD
jgi:signal transduction histidine kinase